MRISASLAALAAGLIFAGTASAAPDRTIELTSGPAPTTATWTGTAGTGLNTSFFLDGTAPGQKGTCGTVDDPRTACETTLVHLTGAPIGGGTATFRIDGFQPVSDFDLRVSNSDETGGPDGDPFDPTGDSESGPLGDLDPRATSAGDFETVTVSLPEGDGTPLDQYFVVQVPYFLVASDSYTGTVKLETTPYVAPDPEEG
jgi:hypothetical protein